MKRILVERPGGPDALQLVDAEMPRPDRGEALVRIEAIGVNYLDVYHRNGLYPLPTPFTPGSEAAGVVEEVGPDTAGIEPGMRVGYIHRGAYAEYTVVPAAKLVPLPDEIDARTAAASLLQGITAHYLTTSTYPIARGDRVLVHAAAGGVGGLLVQMAKERGAFVFATASSAKLAIAREAGADVVIDYTERDFAAEIAGATDGQGVHVVYDSVGRTTFDRSLDCLRTRGMLVLFGQSSGPVPPFDPLRLNRGSLFLTRPTIAHYTAERDELLWRAREMFDAIRSGRLRIRIDRALPLHDAPAAHRLLESRQTAGKLLLLP